MLEVPQLIEYSTRERQIALYTPHHGMKTNIGTIIGYTQEYNRSSSSYKQVKTIPTLGQLMGALRSNKIQRIMPAKAKALWGKQYIQSGPEMTIDTSNKIITVGGHCGNCWECRLEEQHRKKWYICNSKFHGRIKTLRY